MKESVLDVLRYLFEHIAIADAEEDRDREELRGALAEAGFSDGQIGEAFAWLDALGEERPSLGATTGSRPLRVLADAERRRLSPEAWGLLLNLERSGVLDPARREMVLEQVMALEGDALGLEDLKWVVLLVLFAQPDQEAACAWLESEVLAPRPLRH